MSRVSSFASFALRPIFVWPSPICRQTLFRASVKLVGSSVRGEPNLTAVPPRKLPATCVARSSNIRRGNVFEPFRGVQPNQDRQRQNIYAGQSAIAPVNRRRLD